ncbi:MAG: class I SAM-dependent methyltransferase [Holosporales bacterium]|jgi:SAM-dependent methyltransferase|nr:class I SAM-dependent methyltransferase [Holosporales bacterium]
MTNLTTQDTFSSALVYAKNYHRWCLSAFQNYIHGDLLEIGVAHGSYYELLPSNIRYVGLDINPSYVADAKKRGLKAFVADIVDPDLYEKADGMRFDCILCFNVLEHILEDARALENLAHLLKDGGGIFVSLCRHFLFYFHK